MWDLLPEISGQENAPLKWSDFIKRWKYSPLTSTYIVETEDNAISNHLVALLERLKDHLCRLGRAVKEARVSSARSLKKFSGKVVITVN